MRRLIVFSVFLIVLGTPMVYAEPFGNDAFRQIWEQTDYPVQQGAAEHSWIWGPESFTPLLREYFVPEGAAGTRQLQYIDKGRMELNDPDADPNAPWYVTSGLLGRELISGEVQVGYDAFVPLGPANIAVAGDPDNDFPTYASLERLYGFPAGDSTGDYITRVFLREGAGAFEQYAGDPAVEIVRIENEFGIPRAFWDYMTGNGTVFRDGQFVQADPLFDWTYVTGLPVTDAHWTRVRVDGVEREVLFQAFERRVLTYNPANPPQFQVEMGNIGRHYYSWRYEQPFQNGRQALISVPPEEATVSSPLLVQGFESGAAFEAGIIVQLRDDSGNVLAEEGTFVQRPDIGMAGPFSTTLTFASPGEPAPGTIAVVVTSPRDGSRSVIASRPVMIGAGFPTDAPVDQVRRDLAGRLAIDPAAITVEQVEAVEWDNTALECPAPDEFYATVLTPGYRIILQAQGDAYTYHTDTEDEFRICEDGQPVPPPDDGNSGAAISVPASGADVTLPLHIHARVGEPVQTVTAELALTDGIVFSATFELLPGPDGVGLLIGNLGWTDEGPPPAYENQPATLSIRGRDGRALTAQQVRVLSPDGNEVDPVDLYWLLGEDYTAEQRLVPATPRIGTAALEELLWGPPPRNLAGFTTALPTPEEVLNYAGREADWGVRVRLLGLTIEDGVATANFSQELRAYGGGSARVQAIREQISRTLLQFSTVDEVRIAIEGEIDGVLQP
jgi:hypothetical protein